MQPRPPRSLREIFSSKTGSLYEIAPRPQRPADFHSYVVSTPATRKLCSDPFVIGYEYRQALRAASMTALHKGPLRAIIDSVFDSQLNVLHFLRGGLSFQLMDALGELGRMGSKGSFMSSERYSTVEVEHPEQHEWHIHKDQYIELNLVPQSVLLIGDISASGITLKAGLAKIAQRYGRLSEKEMPDFVKPHLTQPKHPQKEDNEASLKHLIFVTIGGQQAEDILLQYHELFHAIFPDFSGSSIVYVEGLFHTADDDAPLINGEPGTDLIPWGASMAPEFEALLKQNPWIGLEACMVYDGGSRSFNPPIHYHSVIEYAEKVQRALDQGVSPFRLIGDRWEGVHQLDTKVKKALSEKIDGDLWVSNRLAQVNKRLGAHL